ncbi:MAG: phage Gp37/Gp68 family protein [Candidatus Manganitrophus sp. SB1]|nr:phage Gp37/Gp68 family protein [Candidatus Manganitrophus morganii]
MATESHIEWTDTTWNPVTGCSKVSQGCKNCYAERLAHRLQAMGLHRYRNGFDVTLHEQAINEPFSWKKPRKVFVNSMSDLFHEEIPLEYIQRVFAVMAAVPRHTFQILTKRSDRLREVTGQLPWPSNVWMGVSVESSDMLFRVTDLETVPAAVRFLSCEPLLGPLSQIPLSHIHWVIVGGESGPGARPMEPPWVYEILHQCRAANVPFFFKQWGGVRKSRTGRVLNGRTYDEYPDKANALLVPV